MIFNLIANYAGNFLPKLILFLALPIISSRLGIEAVGIMGIQFLLVSVMTVFHQSLGRTANRVCAQASVGDDAMVKILFAIEHLFLLMGAIMAICCYLGRGWIAHAWIGPTHFPDATLLTSVALLGAMSGAQITQVFYYNSLLGLGRHKIANILLGVGDVLRYGGIIPILIFTQAGLIAVLAWQTALSLVQCASMAWLFWRSIPQLPPRTFDIRPAVRDVGQYTAGLAVIVFLSVLTTQIDRFMISAILPIALFGQYTIVSNLARLIPLLVGPISNVFFPKLSADLVGDHTRLASDYHTYAQLVTLVTVPSGLFLAVFAKDVLSVYTGGVAWTPLMAPALSFLAIGLMLAAFQEAPYILQLANGWTTLHLKLLAGLLVPLVGATWFMARLAGSQGVASVSILLGLGYLVIGVPLMHRKLLQGEGIRWLTRVLLPLAISAGICAVAYAATAKISTSLYRLLAAVPFGLVAFAVTALVSPDLRRHGHMLLDRYRATQRA